MVEPNARRSVIPKASDVVAAELRRRILAGRLAPGTPLPGEAALMEEFGLGRGSVREALRLVESEGLISVKRGPQGGAVVTRPDLTNVTRSLASWLSVAQAPLGQLTGFRNVLEPAAAALAAKHATDEQCEALLAAAKSDAAYQESGPPFHTLIAQATNDEMFQAVLSIVYNLMVWHHAEPFDQDSENTAVMHKAHQKIAAAIARGDAAGAERAMRQHVEAEERILAEAVGLERPMVPQAVWRQAGPSV
jgi:GntR family transcriptional repressor for pyruvate dehydrogenase complex